MILTHEQVLTLKSDRGFCEQKHKGAHGNYKLFPAFCGTITEQNFDDLLETCEALFKASEEYKKQLLEANKMIEKLDYNAYF